MNKYGVLFIYKHYLLSVEKCIKLQQVVLTFVSVDEILKGAYSNESSQAVLSCSDVLDGSYFEPDKSPPPLPRSASDYSKVLVGPSI